MWFLVDGISCILSCLKNSKKVYIKIGENSQISQKKVDTCFIFAIKD